MTRINCIPVRQLTDQHLIAEYREITRISRLAKPITDKRDYRMGIGHVRFFYDKGKFLEDRCEKLYRECIRRGFNVIQKTYKPHPKGLHRNWRPSHRDRQVNLERLKEKIEMRPSFYRYCGELFEGY